MNLIMGPPWSFVVGLLFFCWRPLEEREIVVHDVRVKMEKAGGGRSLKWPFLVSTLPDFPYK
jgi:hypothetical protein